MFMMHRKKTKTKAKTVHFDGFYTHTQSQAGLNDGMAGQVLLQTKFYCNPMNTVSFNQCHFMKFKILEIKKISFRLLFTLFSDDRYFKKCFF